MEYLLQLRTDLAFCRSNPYPEPCQLYGSSVQYIAFFRNAFLQLAHQFREFRQASSVLRQVRVVIALRQQEHFQRTERLHACLYLHQLFHVQHAADPGPLHCLRNIIQPAERKTPAGVYDPQCFRCFHMHPLHGFKIRRDALRQQFVPSQLRGRLFCGTHFYFVKLQRFDSKTPCNTIVHGIPLSLLQPSAEMNIKEKHRKDNENENDRCQ